jgi:glutathione S-transferase
MSESKPVLYHLPFFCSSRPLQVIHALGIEDKIDVKVVDWPTIKSPEYLKLNPHGSVPTLVESDGSVIIESGAIALHLAEKYAGKDSVLLGGPDNSGKRAKLLQWLFYAPATMYPLMAVGYAESHLPEGAKDPSRVARAKERFQTCAALVRDSLGDKDFLLGTSEPTLADIFVGYEMFGAQHLQWIDEASFPTLVKYVDRLKALPSFKKTYGL